MNGQVDTPQREPVYDGLRAVAILMVLYWHCFNNLIHTQNAIAFRIITLSSSYCWSGVDLFFVLSGFLLGRILLKNKNSKNYFKTFYIRRVCRIFPLYYLYFTIFLVLYFSGLKTKIPWLFENTLPLWSYATYTQNFLMAKFETLGSHGMVSTWSLAVEEQFYLILPILVFIFNKSKMIWLFLLFFILAFVFRITSSNWIESFALIQCRADSLLIGIIIALFVSNHQFQLFYLRNKNIFKGILVLYMIVYVLISVRVLSINYYILNSYFAVFYALIIVIIAIDKRTLLHHILENIYLQRIGVISYGIYMYHMLILGLCHYLILKSSPQINSISSLLVTIFSLVLSVLVAFISYEFFERRVINFGRTYQY